MAAAAAAEAVAGAVVAVIEITWSRKSCWIAKIIGQEWRGLKLDGRF